MEGGNLEALLKRDNNWLVRFMGLGDEGITVIM